MNMQNLKAPEWANYLIFAWPPLSYSGGPLPEVAVFDLEHQPTTYDIIPWLCVVKTLGAEKVHFAFEGKIQNWKYSNAEAWKRFGNITIPAVELFKMPWEIGKRRPGFAATYHSGLVNDLFKEKGKIEKVPLIYDDRKGYVTVTFRDSIRNKWRDSNRKEWDKFIDWLERNGEEVIILEDGDAHGYNIDLKRRWTLYSNAKMNFGVNGGTIAICHYSEAPYMTFKCWTAGQEGAELEHHQKKGGFPKGSQFAFKNDKQELFYEDDNFENLTRAYERIIGKRVAIAA